MERRRRRRTPLCLACSAAGCAAPRRAGGWVDRARRIGYPRGRRGRTSACPLLRSSPTASPSRSSASSGSTRDRLEVTGRWYGLRGHRFVRPVLVVQAGDEQRRMLAVLEHKPWAADDGEEWIAAFPWEGEPVELTAAELAVAPSLAVDLPVPQRPRRAPQGAGARRGAAAGPPRPGAEPAPATAPAPAPQPRRRPDGRARASAPRRWPRCAPSSPASRPPCAASPPSSRRPTRASPPPAAQPTTTTPLARERDAAHRGARRGAGPREPRPRRGRRGARHRRPRALGRALRARRGARRARRRQLRAQERPRRARRRLRRARSRGRGPPRRRARPRGARAARGGRRAGARRGARRPAVRPPGPCAPRRARTATRRQRTGLVWVQRVVALIVLIVWAIVVYKVLHGLV